MVIKPTILAHDKALKYYLNFTPTTNTVVILSAGILWLGSEFFNSFAFKLNDKLAYYHPLQLFTVVLINYPEQQ